MPILTYKQKPKLWKEEVICQCDCLFTQHKLTFDRFWWVNKEGKPEYENISVYLGPGVGVSIWKRIQIAFNYVFRKHKIYYSYDVLFSEDNAYQLKEAIDWLEKSTKEIIDDKE